MRPIYFYCVSTDSISTYEYFWFYILFGNCCHCCHFCYYFSNVVVIPIFFYNRHLTGNSYEILSLQAGEQSNNNYINNTEKIYKQCSYYTSSELPNSTLKMIFVLAKERRHFIQSKLFIHFKI